MKESMKLIDKPTFFGSLALLLMVTIPLIIWPVEGAKYVLISRDFVVDNFGSAYLMLGLGAFLFMLYVVFSDIGRIKLGDPGSEPEFKTASWASMLFCAGIGVGIMVWAPIEWAYYYQSPPFLLEGGTSEAMKWATVYGIFHWGPIAWSIYLVPALPIAYFYHVRKNRKLKLSEAVAPLIGNRNVRGFWGKLIDILFVFGMLGGGATSLGLGAPLLNEGLHILFGFEKNMTMQIIVLIVATAIFGASAYSGIKKGIQTLSNFNLLLAVILLVFVIVVGPTAFIAEASLSSLGVLFDNFFSMATYLEPFGGMNGYADTSFPQDWTIFYWAWWLAYAPTIGLFIARISYGRTMGSMVLGSLFYGSVGCALFFMVLGNYGLHLQLSGTLDVVNILNTDSQPAAVFAILGSLPFKSIVIALYTVLAIVFLATTFDSISYILASVVQKEVKDEPMRWNRLFWAGTLSFLPITLLFLGDLKTLQTASIVAGAPLVVISVMLCISIYKTAKYDLHRQSSVPDPEIDLDGFPEHDPWSQRGTWDDK
ncbi:MAG: BCCT family betaine/carnitine transporter [Arenicella sp.]|jgi:BCCT family betaine/carnitine transporter